MTKVIGVGAIKKQLGRGRKKEIGIGVQGGNRDGVWGVITCTWGCELRKSRTLNSVLI